MTVSQHAQYQDPETESDTWDSAIIHFIIYTCAFPSVNCQNVFWEKKKAYSCAALKDFLNIYIHILLNLKIEKYKN